MAEVPGPKGRWLVGSLPEYEKDRLGWLVRSRAEYGDVVRLSPDAVVVHGAAEAHRVLVGTNDDYLLDSAALAGARQRAALRTREPAFMRRRRAVTRSLSRHLGSAEIAKLVALFRRELERADDTPELVSRCRAICGRALAEFSVGPAAELTAAAYASFQHAMRTLESGEARVRWLRRPNSARTRRSDAEFDRLLRAHLDSRAADTGTLLAELASQTGDPASLRAATRMLVFSAQGVPGVAMAWLLIRLAEHPEYRQAIHDELGARDVATAVQEPLPITTTFVHEVLRLHPPQWMFSRTTTSPVTLSGYTIGEGQQVIITPYLLHRDVRYWDNPDEFSPDRWHRKPDRQAFLPFGAGPRACPGASLGMVALLALAALFARDYRFELTGGGSAGPAFQGLLLPDPRAGGRIRRL